MMRDKQKPRAGFGKRLPLAVFGGLLLVTTLPLAAEEWDVIVSVPGIPGPYCAYGVEKRLFELDGISRVDLLWEKEQIRIVIADGNTVTLDQVLTAFEKSEYPYDYKILGP